MNYPRVLVISNQCFSKSTSNGRTLGLLFKGWPKDKLAQFCLSLTDADLETCTNYYSVSDRVAMKAFISVGTKCPPGQRISSVREATGTSQPTRNIHRTAMTMLLRNAVWKSRLWETHELHKWLKDFDPEIVLLQSGDAAFMADLARRVSKHFNAKLAIFNTEGYIFFHHNYLHNHWSDFLAFPLFRKMYRSSFMKMFRDSSLSIYLNDSLDTDYQALRPHKSVVIYNSSELEFTPTPGLSITPIFSYLGNLGIKRPEALAEFASVLHEVRPDCQLDVYGKLPEQYRNLMENTPGLVYHGVVPYEKVKEIIRSSDFLVHVEKDDPILTNELRYAFSTKIADCICSGRNFIIYAPSNLACSKYIRETNAGWSASNIGELRKLLKLALCDDNARAKKIVDANKASQNHRSDLNQKRFREALYTLTLK